MNKAKQIEQYYIFHKKISNIFNFGNNPFYKPNKRGFFLRISIIKNLFI